MTTRIARFACMAALACAGAGLAVAAQAQSTAADAELPSIGFVNIGRIFSDSAYVDAVRQEIDNEFVTREQELEAKVAEFKELQQQQSGTQLAQTSSQKAEVEERMRDMERYITREDRDLSEDKRARFEEANRDLETYIAEKIKEVASARQIYVVLALSSVLFAEKRLDLTEDVIQALDQGTATQ